MDAFIGQNVDEHLVEKKLGSGAIGTVYLARNTDINECRALKFIHHSKLRHNWKKEIEKVTALRLTEHVVRFHSYSEIEIKNERYICTQWDYIEGETLRKLIDEKKVTVPMMVDIVNAILGVLHACKIADIHHSDLHAGNILIQNTDPYDIEGNRRKTWITDFSYGISGDGLTLLDDYLGFARIVKEMVESINFHSLEVDQRHAFSILKHEFPKILTERNPLEGEYVGNPSEIKKVLAKKLLEKPDIGGKYTKSMGDFLAAESIGERYDEWKALFVPRFLASTELLDTNICLITGLRGCGKTTMFKRLSFPLTHKLGQVDLGNRKSTIGFYLNARHIAETFPWLPDEKENEARNQIIHFFHLKWCREIIEWIKVSIIKDKLADLLWLDSFFSKYYGEKYQHTSSTKGAGFINHIINFLDEELQECKLGARYMPEIMWPMRDNNFLESFVMLVKKECNIPEEEYFYFFLDDYSTPMVNRAIQKILNPVIFSRSSEVVFKVSTENSETFVPIALNEKQLEEGHDYRAVDLGIEALQKREDSEESVGIIEAVFQNRIKRIYPQSRLDLSVFLGKEHISGNRRAKIIRGELPGEASEEEDDGGMKTKYYGLQVFKDLWSSDIREMIKLFSTMLSLEGKDNIDEKVKNDSNPPLISIEKQDVALRQAGGLFIRLLRASTDPTLSRGEASYGEHLENIVVAFHKMAYHDLKNKTSKNEGKIVPKQTRRIEVKTTSLSEAANRYLRGLIRYGIFIRDDRAKNVGGELGRRLYLRGLLIPIGRITFSKRDSIIMTQIQFEEFLLSPIEFAKNYVKGINEDQSKITGGWE